MTNSIENLSATELLTDSLSSGIFHGFLPRGCSSTVDGEVAGLRRINDLTYEPRLSQGYSHSMKLAGFSVNILCTGLLGQPPRYFKKSAEGYMRLLHR